MLEAAAKIEMNAIEDAERHLLLWYISWILSFLAQSAKSASNLCQFDLVLQDVSGVRKEVAP